MFDNFYFTTVMYVKLSKCHVCWYAYDKLSMKSMYVIMQTLIMHAMSAMKRWRRQSLGRQHWYGAAYLVYYVRSA